MLEKLYIKHIASQLDVKDWQVEHCIALFEEGATVPFISRYRKERTGALDEVQVAEIRFHYLKFIDLDKRKQSILASIGEQGKLNAQLESDIKAKIELVRSYSDEVEKISGEDIVGNRDKLEAKIRAMLDDAKISPDENRLLTECAIWADKIAIDEELVRLRSHFGAFYDICSSKEPSGRKLDFLMQELNRETNTIGSKANNARIARIVVNMKGELEKIREQVQNVE